jgi:hypothetical protein
VKEFEKVVASNFTAQSALSAIEPVPQEQESQEPIEKREERIGEERIGEEREPVLQQAAVQEQLEPEEMITAERVTGIPMAASTAALAAEEPSAKIEEKADASTHEPVTEAAAKEPGPSVAEAAVVSPEHFAATTPAVSSEPAVEGVVIGSTPEVAREVAKEVAKKESEISETTAAAWASWRRIRESGEPRAAKPVEARAAAAELDAGLVAAERAVEKLAAEALGVPDLAIPEFGNNEKEAVPQPEAARAVAAGAERSPEEVPAGSDSSEIASIVDSMLADLRPKMLEEISRKLGKKK